MVDYCKEVEGLMRVNRHPVLIIPLGQREMEVCWQRHGQDIRHYAVANAVSRSIACVSQDWSRIESQAGPLLRGGLSDQDRDVGSHLPLPKVSLSRDGK